VHVLTARARRSALAFVLILFALPSPAHAQHAHAASHAPATTGAEPFLPGLGNHHHPITTSSALAQRYFDQGLSLAYAFNHAEAKRSFEAALRLDPGCAMCHWGIAYVLGPNMNAPMDTASNAEARQAAQRALALSQRVSAREREYIDAMARRYAHDASASRAPLDSAFANGMRDVARRYPDDADAAAIFAEAMMNLSPWTYWSKGKPLPGTTELLYALERGMRVDPSNPGACHFYIHAVESAYPERAVACAERLAALMPGAGHIVHMPAHIYLRVGRYNDAITANEHAVHADEAYLGDRPAQGFYAISYYPHNFHFLAFAATMAGRGAKAMEAARGAAEKVPTEAARSVPDLQLVTAFPHLTLAAFGRWSDILAEPLPSTELRLATGLAWYARGAAFAAREQWSSAEAALDSVNAAAIGLQPPVDVVLAIATHVLSGEIAMRRGRHEDAIAHLSGAMRLEDGLSYMEPPYWHRPVRHLLGGALLRAGRASEAERAFREDLQRFPENVWSLRGLERSLVAQGRVGEAKLVKERFERAAREADVTLAALGF
jgi:tetratricopeptide (TPR) repeat protein